MERAELKAWFAREILPFEAALRRYLRRNGTPPDELADGVQEIYIRIFERAAQALPEQPRAFAFGIARHIVADRIRRERIVSIDYTQDLQTLNDMLVDEVSPEVRLTSRQELRRLCDALDSLSDRCRDVIWLRRVEGLSQRDAARRLGMHEKALEGYISRGMRTLAKVVFGAETEGCAGGPAASTETSSEGSNGR